MNLPSLVNFSMRALRAAVSFGHEDLAVRRHQHVVRLIEVVRLRCAAGLAERHQQLAFGLNLNT